MRIRNVIAVVGITGTLIVAQLVGNAFAETTTTSLSQATALLNSYRATNTKVGTCMRGKSLTYDAGLVKEDVEDAFSIIPPDEMTTEARLQLAIANNAAAADDPNDALLAAMTPAAQEAWVTAVNDCSTQIDDAAGGGAPGWAKVELARQIAAASSEVKTASTAYVLCMKIRGFTVTGDPYVTPEAISAAEIGETDADGVLADRYTAAWNTCAAPWQDAFDQQLYG